MKIKEQMHTHTDTKIREKKRTKITNKHKAQTHIDSNKTFSMYQKGTKDMHIHIYIERNTHAHTNMCIQTKQQAKIQE